MKQTFHVASACLGLCSLTAISSAAIYQAQINSALVGNVIQTDVPAGNGPSGVNSCCPTAVGNGLALLQNEFPSVYGNSLVGNASYSAVQATATTLATFTYMRTSSTLGTDPHNWVSGEVNFMESVAPGKTIYGGMGNFGISTATYPWYVNADPTFSFLYSELQQDAAVELGMFRNTDGLGHVVTLTALNWNDANNDGIMELSEGATMSFVDPGDGTVHTVDIWQTALNGTMHTDYFNVGTDSGTLVMATSEVAVPEAGSLAMLGLGAVGLLSRRRNSKS